MEIYTIGFTQKTAREFFGLLRRHGIKRLVDVRLRTTSQLSGFAKSDDLEFFLEELCGAKYLHEPLLAPNAELLKGYRKKTINWQKYQTTFRTLMEDREIETQIDPSLFTVPTVLLCSEPTADHCHRRLVAEYLAEKWGDVTITHL